MCCIAAPLMAHKLHCHPSHGHMLYLATPLMAACAALPPLSWLHTLRHPSLLWPYMLHYCPLVAAHTTSLPLSWLHMLCCPPSHSCTHYITTPLIAACAMLPPLWPHMLCHPLT